MRETLSRPVWSVLISVAIAVAVLATVSVPERADAQGGNSFTLFSIPAEALMSDDVQVAIANPGSRGFRVVIDFLDPADFSVIESSGLLNVPPGTTAYYIDEFVSFRTQFLTRVRVDAQAAELPPLRGSVQIFDETGTTLSIFSDGFESGDAA